MTKSEPIKSKIAKAFEHPDKTSVLGAFVGACHYLKVVSVIESGAFLACGLAKDLFVPVGEQLKIMRTGESYIVYVYRDPKTGRVAGSSKLNKHLFDDAPDGMKENDEVSLLIYARTDLGYKAVVNGTSWGVLYKGEVFKDLHYGQKFKGYIKKIRPDGKIDLALQKAGYEGVPDLSARILSHLEAAGGSAPLSDKTPPEEIHRLFGVSKKKFKMAVGGLYKQRVLTISERGLQLAPASESKK